MSKMWTSKYGTQIDISGLSPEQIKKVQEVTANGAYGLKAQALANSFRKKSGGNQVVHASGNSLGINPNTGQVKPKKAINTIVGGVQGSDSATFNMNNPGSQTDAGGNTQTITRDPVTGETKIVQTGGAGYTQAQQSFLNSLGLLGNNGRDAAFNANYSYMTQGLDQKKAQEIEAAKQELANKGIPVTAGDPNSLYAKTLADIDKKYQTLDDSARQQSVVLGNNTYSTDVNAAQTLGNVAQGQQGNFAQYQGGQSNTGAALLNLLGQISDADLKKYGIDQDTMVRLRAAARAGGGGGGSADSGFTIGSGMPPGYA